MKLQLALALPGGIKIYCNPLNWVLDCGDKNNRWYFASLDELCDELFEQRLKIAATEARRLKTEIHSLAESVRDAREATRNDLERLEKVLTDADRARERGDFRGGTHG